MTTPGEQGIRAARLEAQRAARGTKRVEMKIVVEISADHDEQMLIGYIVGGIRGDENLQPITILEFDANEF